MKKFVCGSLLVAFFWAGGTQPSSAQTGSSWTSWANPGIRQPAGADSDNAAFGGFWDFIHKLSGPEFSGTGGTFAWWPGLLQLWAKPARWREPRIAVRFAYVHHDPKTDTTLWDPAAELKMKTGQATIEVAPLMWPRSVRWEVGAGLALHRFQGAFDHFTHLSYPFFGQASVPVYRRLVVRAGGGKRYFRPFDDEDFQPFRVEIPRNASEWVWSYFGGVEWRF